MPDSKITDLDLLTADAADELVVNRGGVDGKVTALSLRNDVNTVTGDMTFR